MMRNVVALISLLAAFSCQFNNGSDAYGNFEATEVIVSAEANGKLMDFSVEEGRPVRRRQVLGVVDTMQLYLQKQQLIYSIAALKSKIKDVKVQIDVLGEQKENLTREKNRLEALYKDKAATQKQLDDINGEIHVIDRRILATRSEMSTANQGVLAEIAPLEARVKQVDDQLKKSYITSPIDGIVLTKYAETGEYATAGRSLFKVADLENMELRVYVSGDQLTNIRLGQAVEVLVDKDKTTYRSLEGTISWIASEAEFTPKIIQTKDGRVNLVYAVKVTTPNDGTLKIGMPGEVKWKSETN